MPRFHLYKTGQTSCYDSAGREIRCQGTGQDAETDYGLDWPSPRFIVRGEVVLDQLTGLVWTRDANLAGFPLAWQESLDFIARMNHETRLGHDDWRLPNRSEMRSLMGYQARNPALQAAHPFVNYFLGWYWTSTTAAIHPAYAWYVHLEGARMFYGRKDQYCLLWPVRGENRELRRTGQTRCFDSGGNPVQCRETGQDGEFQYGLGWPQPRFSVAGNVVTDLLTGVRWLREADLTGRPVDWDEALAAVREMNKERVEGRSDWQLPNLNVLESLIDCSRHSPALPEGHPFLELREGYWSSTTSYFETDWAWTLYLAKGALGVGHKPGKNFHVWPVCVNR